MKALLGRGILFFEAIAVLLFSFSAFAQAPKSKPITEEELSPWLNQHYDCQADAPPYFWRLEYYDFKGDGNEEAIVVASTCETGTAGPDVHSVFGRDASGDWWN